MFVSPVQAELQSDLYNFFECPWVCLIVQVGETTALVVSGTHKYDRVDPKPPV